MIRLRGVTKAYDTPAGPFTALRVGAFGLMTATSLNVLERRRELGVLRAIGAAPSMVARIVIVENVFAAVMS